MAKVNSAGETDNVPKWLKDSEKEASKKKPCPEIREIMHRCVEEKGIRHADCVEVLEEFNKCQTMT